MKKWKTVATETAFENKWFSVRKDKVELPSGKIIDDYFIWKEKRVSQIVGITTENKIIFVKQYKHGAGEIMIELPAGYVEENEDFKEAANREFSEETGYKITELEEIAKLIHNPTKSSGVVKVFVGKVLGRRETQNLDENEDIEIMEIDIENVLKMIYAGEIWATGTIASIFLALNKIKFE